jgi:phage baseplate assembly protein W
MPYKNIVITPAQYKEGFTKQTSQIYRGYSSVVGSPALYDFDLIKQDFFNIFNTRQGERVMNPKFGTIIWSLIFEPFTNDIKQAIADDINRICNYDPRVVPIQIDISEAQYGMLLELTLQLKGTDQTVDMRLAFDKELGIVTQ